MELTLLPRPDKSAVTAVFSRELTLVDAALLREVPAPKTALQRITDRHHALASALAQGMKPGEAAAYYGYDEGTVTRLKADPTFKNLIEFYRSDDQRLKRGLGERLSGLAADALDLIEERLQDPEERPKIGIAVAMEIAKLGADRSGFGPSATTTQVNVHVGLAERMAAARKKAEPKLIEAVANGP